MTSPVIAGRNRIVHHWGSTNEAHLSFDVSVAFLDRFSAFYIFGIRGRASTKAATFT